MVKEPPNPQASTVPAMIRRLGIFVSILGVLILYGALIVNDPDAREQEIAQRIAAMNGKTRSERVIPSWITGPLAKRLPFSRRIKAVKFFRPEFVLNDAVTNNDLELLKELSSLEELSLFDVSITDNGLRHVGDLKNLKHLDLDCREITDRGLMFLKGLTNLESLSVIDADITDATLPAIAALPKLEKLKLSGTRITDAGLENLYGMTNLRFLNITGKGLTSTGMKNLREALPDCHISGDSSPLSEVLNDFARTAQESDLVAPTENSRMGRGDTKTPETLQSKHTGSQEDCF